MANLPEKEYRRILFIFGFCFLTTVVLLMNLIVVQLVKHSDFARLAAAEHCRILLKNNLRGSILDRNGTVLRKVHNEWYLTITPSEPAKRLKIREMLSSEFEEKYLGQYLKSPNNLFWVYPHPLTKKELNWLKSHQLPQFKVVSSLNARDQLTKLAWHVLGQVQQEQGISGLEYNCNPQLRDNRNHAILSSIMDGRNQYFPGLGLRSRNNIKSPTIVLTLDSRIQKIIEDVLDKEQIKGAIVVLDAKNGAILAMASRPLVNLKDLSSSINDPGEPFLNRAVSAYLPGSIFKLVVLSAALDSGIVSAQDQFLDRGVFELSGRTWTCQTSGGKGHGVIDPGQALAYSCNPIFIEIGLKLQPKLILDYADKFGMGQPTNIGLLDEAWGELPTGIGLSPGGQANLALGQESVYTTPLQIASLVQTIANNGIRQRPWLIAAVTDSKGNFLEKKFPIIPERVLKTETAKVIQKMMAGVIEYGTGREAQLPSGVAGKTGTAQTGPMDNLQDNAWFAGFTPLKKPRYVTVVFCEKGVSGGKTAAPLFREVMEKVAKEID